MNHDHTPARPDDGPGQWVLLTYHIPREPSAPRIAIWRKLKRLGVAQLGDGLVALPADARTHEQLEWIAEEAIEAGGTAGVWVARPATSAQERDLATSMADARAAEYAKLTAEAEQAAIAAEATRASALRRLRAEMHRITRRDYFPPAARDQARAAIEALATPSSAEEFQP